MCQHNGRNQDCPACHMRQQVDQDFIDAIRFGLPPLPYSDLSGNLGHQYATVEELIPPPLLKRIRDRDVIRVNQSPRNREGECTTDTMGRHLLCRVFDCVRPRNGWTSCSILADDQNVYVMFLSGHIRRIDNPEMWRDLIEDWLYLQHHENYDRDPDYRPDRVFGDLMSLFLQINLAKNRWTTLRSPMNY